MSMGNGLDETATGTAENSSGMLPRAVRIAGAQLPNVVGDIAGNHDRILAAMRWAEGAEADILVLPELALTGYPLQDLVLHREFVAEARAALVDLARHAGTTTTVVSTVDPVPPRRSWDTRERSVAIGAALVADGEIRGMYHKVFLPTYEIFDEARNFAPGTNPAALWRIGDVVAGVSICEDLWSGDGPPEEQSAGGAQVLLVPNASPYHRGKPSGRLRLAASVARRNGVPVVYVNFVGGQDELVFDGGSIIVDADGILRHRAAAFAEERFVVDVPIAAARPVTGPLRTVHTRPLRRRAAPASPAPAAPPREAEMVWQALVTGTRDFAAKNDFGAAVLGLSGGIDAAVAAAVAADALGPANVLGVAMPGEDTPADELADAKALAAGLGIDFATVHLADLRELVTDGLGDLLDTRTSPDPSRGCA
jgi:NAD+ synthase (glutamine-hydrolysing)